MDEALEQSNKAWVVKQPHQDSQPSTSEALIHCASRSDHSLTEVDEDGSTGGESDEGKPPISLFSYLLISIYRIQRNLPVTSAILLM